MVIDGAGLIPPSRELPVTERLGLEAAAELRELYAVAGMPFSEELLATGCFYGARHGGHLIAAGGTHTVAAKYGIAALGNLYVLPEQRRRGYGEALTLARVAELSAQGHRDIICNIAHENAASIQLHERLGFYIYCRFWRGELIRRDQERLSVG
jgi:ribosomal protein S18 acetylase RimI-like enzyme